MNAWRYGIPAAFAFAGLVVVAIGGMDLVELWAMLFGAALAMLVWTALVNLGLSGESDRRAEEDARDFLTEHGHWPDEAPPDQ